MYELVLRAPDGATHILRYDPHTSALTDVDGNNVIADLDPQELPAVHRVSPDNPGRKSSAPRRLKIQVGLKCNYSCSYCLQASQIKHAANTNLDTAQAFIANLDSWLTGSPVKFEFWGGEPLLYWRQIKYLLAELHLRYPQAGFLIVTNGSLLTEDYIEHAETYDIETVISHDGPGQTKRGPDPLDVPAKRLAIETLLARRPTRTSINAVLTPGNHDIEAIEEWFKARLSVPAVINLEGVVISYDGGAASAFTPEQYKELTINVAKVCMRPLSQIPGSLQQKLRGWVKTLQQGRNSLALGQKCGMDRPDQLAVDLQGNVLTCQNTGGVQGSEHRIGHVSDLAQVALTTAWHWSHREECSHCPVLQLCAGSCMYVQGADWYHACNNEYAYNLGVMAGALFHLTGMTLVEIRGETYRPDPDDYLRKE